MVFVKRKIKKILYNFFILKLYNLTNTKVLDLSAFSNTLVLESSTFSNTKVLVRQNVQKQMSLFIVFCAIYKI